MFRRLEQAVTCYDVIPIYFVYEAALHRTAVLMCVSKYKYYEHRSETNSIAKEAICRNINMFHSFSNMFHEEAISKLWFQDVSKYFLLEHPSSSIINQTTGVFMFEIAFGVKTSTRGFHIFQSTLHQPVPSCTHLPSLIHHPTPRSFQRLRRPVFSVSELQAEPQGIALALWENLPHPSGEPWIPYCWML